MNNPNMNNPNMNNPNMNIPNEKITLDNIKYIVQKQYDSKLMKQYLLRDVTKTQLEYIYFETCIKAYYGNNFYNDLFIY